MAARIDQAANAREIADLEFGDLIADAGNAPDDFVAGHHRINGVAPFAAHLMDIGMADAAKLDFDENIARAKVAALEIPGRKLVGGGMNGVAFGWNHFRSGCRWKRRRDKEQERHLKASGFQGS